MNQLSVISGGQTGADLAGLWVARCFGLSTGGFAPAAYRTQLGHQPKLAEFGLIQTKERDYRARTLKNVDSSTCTLVCSAVYSPGTRLTVDHAKHAHKMLRYCVFDQSDLSQSLAYETPHVVAALKRMMLIDDVVLNVAGNSTATAARSFDFTFNLLWSTFSQLGLNPVCVEESPSVLCARLKDKYDMSLLNIKRCSNQHQIDII